MVPALLRTLKARGYRIVHLVPGAGAGATKAAPPGWSSETDRIIAGVFREEARSGPAYRGRQLQVRHFGPQDGPAP